MLHGTIANYTLEKRFIHKNNSIVHTILTVTTVKKVNGDISHFIAQLIDVSPMISSENKTKELLKITKQQNESLLNFAHIVSHNLRSHSANLLMLSNFINSEKNQQEKKHLELMLKNASESLNETVQHLTEVVSIKNTNSENLSEVDILKALGNVRKNIGALIEKDNVICKVQIPKNEKILAIAAYLESIFLNLFTNSIKYKSHLRKLIIEINYKKVDDSIILYFSDNGQGIDLERYGDKLFGMYKTFHGNADAKGIGLYITKNQIEAMNGSINVQSKVNEGAMFILTFKSANETKLVQP